MLAGPWLNSEAGPLAAAAGCTVATACGSLELGRCCFARRFFLLRPPPAAAACCCCSGSAEAAEEEARESVAGGGSCAGRAPCRAFAACGPEGGGAVSCIMAGAGGARRRSGHQSPRPLEAPCPGSAGAIARAPMAPPPGSRPASPAEAELLAAPPRWLWRRCRPPPACCSCRGC